MSLAALDWAFNQEVLSSSQKFVLVALANHANETTANAFPSIETLCRETEMDRKTVIRSLDRLVDGRWITETGKRVGKTGKVKVYHFHRVTVPKTEPLNGEMVAQQSPNGAANGGAMVAQWSQKRNSEPVTSNREPRTGGEQPPEVRELSSGERISAEKELERINDRLAEIRNMSGRNVYGEATYDEFQLAERKKLRDRREVLKERLGVVI